VYPNEPAELGARVGRWAFGNRRRADPAARRRALGARLFVRLIVLLALQGVPLNAGQEPRTPRPAPRGELDLLMERVLARRDETWKRLNQYVLDERESLEILAPGRLPLHRMSREYTWYEREGILVRSPVRAKGVAVSEEDRRRYEADWLAEERRREERRKDKMRDAARADGPSEDTAGDTSAATLPAATPTDADDVAVQAIEPRFVSEAYFLRFRFEPGNYYFVGREALDGREVLRIEYYPSRLFVDDDEAPPREDEREVEAAKGKHGRTRSERSEEDKERELDYERKFNKVSLVTVWVDPAAEQIVRYTFDNVDFNFLPGRSIVRIESVRASMTMGRFLDGVWLPRGIEMTGAVTLASGRFSVRYGRDFSDYRQAETSATIRAFGPVP